MGIMDEVQQLARSGRPADGIRLVEDRAVAGNAEAMFIVANWRFWGLYGPKNLDDTHVWLERAAKAGWTEAALLRANLINNGTACAADPLLARSILEDLAEAVPAAAKQLDLLDRMRPPEDAQWTAELLCDDPVIRVIPDFFAAHECEYVRHLAEPSMRPSMIYEPVTGRPIPHPFRTSTSTNFGPLEEDLVIHALNRRIAAATATDPAAGEPLHVLRYVPGQEFRPHHDAIEGERNQRRWTAIVYLNEDYEGGQTEFPKVAVRVAGRTGDCLIFRNTTETGAAHPDARHAGLPVTAGAKWVASRWIREQPYEPEVAPSR